jgi:hypothetical protein
MNITTTRYLFTDNSVIGKLTVDGEFLLYTMEPTDRGLDSDMQLEEVVKRKIPGKTAIPIGTYKLILVSGAGIWARFHFLHDKYTITEEAGKIPFEVPELQGITDFSQVLLHPGNYPKDTEGCSLVGNSASPDFIGGTPAAFEALRLKCFDAIRKGEATYTITRDEIAWQAHENALSMKPNI